MRAFEPARKRLFSVFYSFLSLHEIWRFEPNETLMMKTFVRILASPRDQIIILKVDAPNRTRAPVWRGSRGDAAARRTRTLGAAAGAIAP